METLTFIIIAAVLILLIAGLTAGLLVFFLRKHKKTPSTPTVSELSPEETARRLAKMAGATNRLKKDENGRMRASVTAAAAATSGSPPDIKVSEASIRRAYVVAALQVLGTDATEEEQTKALQATYDYISSDRYVDVDLFDERQAFEDIPPAMQEKLKQALKNICDVWFPGSVEAAVMLAFLDVDSSPSDGNMFNQLSDDDHLHILYIMRYPYFQPRPKRMQRADVLKAAKGVLESSNTAVKSIDYENAGMLDKAWFGDSQFKFAPLFRDDTNPFPPEKAEARLRAVAETIKSIAFSLNDAETQDGPAALPENDIRSGYQELAVFIRGSGTSLEEEKQAFQAMRDYVSSDRYVNVPAYDKSTLPPSAIRDQLKTEAGVILRTLFPESAEANAIIAFYREVIDAGPQAHYDADVATSVFNKLDDTDHTLMVYILRYPQFQPRPKRMQYQEVVEAAAAVFMQHRITIRNAMDPEYFGMLNKAWFGDSRQFR